MADDKKVDTVEPITLVAVERGFAMGRMVEPGTKFKFRPVKADGSPRKLPKWAAEVEKAPPKKAPPASFDTKPKDAQDAVKKKAGQLSGTDLA